MVTALVAMAAIAALVALAYLQSRERQAEADRHARERRELYIRIQSPELAPMLAPRPDDEDEAEPLPGRRTELEEIRALVGGDGS